MNIYEYVKIYNIQLQHVYTLIHKIILYFIIYIKLFSNTHKTLLK